MNVPTFLVTALVAAVTGLGEAAAARFILDSGELVEGTVVHGTRNTLTVLRDAGGIRQIAVSRLARIEARAPDGGTVTGRLATIEGTRIGIRTPDRQTVWLEGGRVLPDDRGPERAERALAAVKPGATGPPTETMPARPPVPQVATAPREAAAAGRERGTPAPASEVVAAWTGAQPPSAASGVPPHVRIRATAEEVAETEGSISFALELSKPSTQPIRLVYSTVDGAAAAGDDYEAQQGVVSLPAGKTSYKIEAVLIDDDQREDPEQFFLFVTADPKLATVEDKWRTVTIVDDD